MPGAERLPGHPRRSAATLNAGRAHHHLHQQEPGNRPHLGPAPGRARLHRQAGRPARNCWRKSPRWVNPWTAPIPSGKHRQHCPIRHRFRPTGQRAGPGCATSRRTWSIACRRPAAAPTPMSTSSPSSIGGSRYLLDLTQAGEIVHRRRHHRRAADQPLVPRPGQPARQPDQRDRPRPLSRAVNPPSSRRTAGWSPSRRRWGSTAACWCRACWACATSPR